MLPTTIPIDCGITHPLSTPTTDFAAILMSAIPNAADLYKALNGQSVYIISKTFPLFLSYTAGVSILTLSPTNNSANQRWVLTGGLAPTSSGTGNAYQNSSGGWRIACAADPLAVLLLADGYAWIRYGNAPIEGSRDIFTITSGNCGSVLSTQSADPAQYMITNAKSTDPIRSATAKSFLAINDAVRYNRGQMWSIILADTPSFCSGLPVSYGFNIAPCRALPPGALKNTLATNYCVGRGANGQSLLMSDKDCAKWCNTTPDQCENIMVQYCTKYPNAPECQCIYANKQADYAQFIKLNPTISGHASCFTQACRGTNLSTHLIPQSIQKIVCPSIITQRTDQQVNVGAGAVVTGLNISATQSASSGSSSDSSTQDVGGNGATQTVTKDPIVANVAIPIYTYLFIFIIIAAVFFAWIMMGDDVPEAQPNAEIESAPTSEQNTESESWF